MLNRILVLDDNQDLLDIVEEPQSNENFQVLVTSDSHNLIEIAKTETNPDIRSRAIRNVGIFGGDGAVPALTSIYNSNADVETKKQIIKALFVHGAAKDMVALARKETNPELKKELVRNLALMDSPDATDYMMEILNK